LLEDRTSGLLTGSTSGLRLIGIGILLLEGTRLIDLRDGDIIYGMAMKSL